MDNERKWKDMDKLDKIFYMQKSFQEELIKKRHLEHITMEEWLQKQTLAIVAELAEVLDESNYRWWKAKKPLNEAQIKEEIIDVLHFVLSMCVAAGMDSDEIFSVYMAKNKENFDRQNGLSNKHGYTEDKPSNDTTHTTI